MFGLFKNSYDYYEWHNLVCISASEDDLREYFNSLNQICPLLDGAAKERASHAELWHYVIEPVTCI